MQPLIVSHCVPFNKDPIKDGSLCGFKFKPKLKIERVSEAPKKSIIKKCRRCLSELKKERIKK